MQHPRGGVLGILSHRLSDGVHHPPDEPDGDALFPGEVIGLHDILRAPSKHIPQGIFKSMSLLSKGGFSNEPAFKLITYLDAAFNLVAVADVHLSRRFVNHPPMSELYRDDQNEDPRLREVVPAARYHETSDPHL